MLLGPVRGKYLFKIQEDRIKQAFKKETNKYERIQENATKQVKEMNKTVQDLKMEINVIQKTKKGANPGERKPREENYKPQASSTDYKRKKREAQPSEIQQKKLLYRSKKMSNKLILIQYTQKIWDTRKRQKLRMVEIKGEESQLKGTENILNKIIEQNIPNLKKEITIKLQEPK